MSYKPVQTKRIRHIWSVLCTNSILDKDSNNLTLNNVVEQITATFSKEDIARQKEEKSKGFAVPVQLQLVTRLQKLSGDIVAFDFSAQLINPAGESVGTTESMSLGFQKGIKNIRLRNNIPQLGLDQPGEYFFSVRIREKGESDFTEVDRVPLDIIFKLPE